MYFERQLKTLHAAKLGNHLTHTGFLEWFDKYRSLDERDAF